MDREGGKGNNEVIWEVQKTVTGLCFQFGFWGNYNKWCSLINARYTNRFPNCNCFHTCNITC
jgi:hypothetical protein